MDSHGKEPTWFGRTLSRISAAITRFQGSLYQPPQTRIDDIDTTDWPSPWQPMTDSEAAEIEKRTREARIRAHEEHAYTATLQGLGTNGPSGPQFEGNEVKQGKQVNKQARDRIVSELQRKMEIDSKANLAERLSVDPSALRAIKRGDYQRGGRDAEARLLKLCDGYKVDRTAW